MPIDASVSDRTSLGRLLERPIVHIVVLLFITFAVYSNTLHAPFVFDDDANIGGNPVLRDFSYFTDIEKINRDEDKGIMRILVTSRYLPFITFYLNYKAHGLSVLGYHLANIAIHAANVILVYMILLLTLRLPRLREGALGAASFLPLAVSSLYAVHPIQTMAVTYITQRFTSLAAFFYLLSMLLYIQSRLTESQQGRRMLYALSLISALGAMKSKEISFTLPCMILLYDICFLGGSVRDRARRLLPFALTLPVIPFTLAHAGGNVGDVMSIEATRKTLGRSTLSMTTYLMTQFSVIMTYLRLALFPFNQTPNYLYPAQRAFLTPGVVAAFAALVMLFSSGLYSLAISMKVDGYDRRYHKFYGFGILWFFLALSVESSIIPIETVINENRLYLPSAGLFLAMASGVWIALRSKSRNVAIVAFIALIICLGITTLVRNQTWANKIRLWEDVVRKYPQRTDSYSNLGWAYHEEGRMEEAEKAFRQAVALEPNSRDALNNLGSVYLKMGRFEDAEREYLNSIEVGQSLVAHINLGNVYFGAARVSEAIDQYEQALRIDPKNSDAHNNLGNIYQSMGRMNEAELEYKASLESNPINNQSLYNLGRVYANQARWQEAISAFTESIRLRPDEPEAYNNIGLIYRLQGSGPEAEREFQRAISANPGFILPYLNLADLYIAAKRHDEADKVLRAALAREPGNAQVIEALRKVAASRVH